MLREGKRTETDLVRGEGKKDGLGKGKRGGRETDWGKGRETDMVR